MSDRFSEPSNSLGVHRFHCWPAGVDSYDHVELTQNWDKLDRIIGVPSSGAAWPPSEGVNGGIYAQFRILQHERVPIGTISYWFRPSVDVPLTTITDLGWAVCDGSSLDDSDHDFPGISSTVTLPDLFNSFVLGADPSKGLGVAGVGVGASSVDSRLGAPGPQGRGGNNSVALVANNLPKHSHGLESTTVRIVSSDGIVYFGEIFVQTTPIVTAIYPDTPTKSLRPALPTLDSEPATPSGHENRPRYIGLIPIIKVKYINTL